ncbi:unnamed protein product [Rotaria magnacalcarata]
MTIDRLSGELGPTVKKNGRCGTIYIVYIGCLIGLNCTCHKIGADVVDIWLYNKFLHLPCVYRKFDHCPADTYHFIEAE